MKNRAFNNMLGLEDLDFFSALVIMVSIQFKNEKGYMYVILKMHMDDDLGRNNHLFKP